MNDIKALALKMKLPAFIDSVGLREDRLIVRVKQPPRGWRELLDADIIPLGFDKPTALSHDERIYVRTAL